MLLRLDRDWKEMCIRDRYSRIKVKNKRFFAGLRIKTDDGDFEDFLS